MGENKMKLKKLLGLGLATVILVSSVGCSSIIVTLAIFVLSPPFDITNSKYLSY